MRRQIERLIDALADGTVPAMSVKGRLADLERRRLALEGDLAATPVPAPRLHPSLAEVYREKVAALAEVLARDDAAAAREAVRALVEAIILIPEDVACVSRSGVSLQRSWRCRRRGAHGHPPARRRRPRRRCWLSKSSWLRGQDLNL